MGGAHSAAANIGAKSGVELIRCDEPGLWDALCRQTPGGSAFHSWAFLDLQQDLLGVTFERLLVTLAGQPVGCVPLARRSMHGLRSPYLPFPHLGPVIEPELLTEVLGAVRRWQMRHGLALVRMDVAPSLADAALAAASSARMTARRDGTVIYDLRHRSIEELDRRMFRSRRQSISRAARRGIVARNAAPGEVASILGAALRDAYGRHDRTSPYPGDVGARVEEWSVGRTDLQLGIVTADDRPIGVNVVLTGHPVAAGWLGACLDGARGGEANEVLVRHMLVRALENGNVALDSGGRVDDAVERYKLSFGGVAAPYVTLEGFLGPNRVLRGFQRRALARWNGPTRGRGSSAVQ